MSRTVFTVVGAVVALAGLSALTPAATAAVPAQRVVAVGDIHGAFDSLVEILQAAELIDAEHRWIGGNSLLVQTGDFLDRGPAVREVLDLLMDLQVEAAAAGGRVVVLLGNHEAMNLVGVLRDVNPAAYADFATADSVKRQEAAYQAYVEFRLRRAKSLAQRRPVFNEIVEREWKQTHPPGFVEYMEALGPTGVYGRWLRQLPVTLAVGDILFIHAGISAAYSKMQLDEIQQEVEQAIQISDRYRRYLVGKDLALPFSSYTEMLEATGEKRQMLRRLARVRGSAAALGSEDQALLGKIEDFRRFRGGLLLESQGPLWYRGPARWSDEAGGNRLASLVKNTGVRYFVCAHTTQLDRRIQARFGGQVFLIDTGMASPFDGGQASALEIWDGRFTAIYAAEREVLLDRPPKPAPLASALAAGQGR